MLIMGFAVIAGDNATGTVNTSEFPAPALIRAPVVPKLAWPVVPVTVPQLDVPFAAQVALAESVMPAGNGSEIVTSNASERLVSATITV
jgi:hypothetical protein